MNQTLKNFLTNWKIIILLVALIFSYVAIQPQFFGNEGATIRSVIPNSSAANGGILNPSPKLTPLAKEKIISIDQQVITSENDYYDVLKTLQDNMSVKVETNKGIYTLLSSADIFGKVDLGMKVYTAPTSNIRKGLDLEGGIRVLLKPEEAVEEDIIELTIDNLKERLNVYGLSDVVVRAASDLSGEDFIVIEIAGVTEEEVKELLAKQGKFEAAIGNETVFYGGKKDITYVCRTADCSGINPSVGCFPSGEGQACQFFFAITLSPEAADKQAELTNVLAVITEENNRYLSDDLVLYLDDVEVDRLRIGAELKGRSTTNIQISGSGFGATQQEAVTIRYKV